MGLNSVSEGRGNGGLKPGEPIGGSAGSRPFAHSRRRNPFEEGRRTAGLASRTTTSAGLVGRPRDGFWGKLRNDLVGHVTGLLEAGMNRRTALRPASPRRVSRGTSAGLGDSRASACRLPWLRPWVGPAAPLGRSGFSVPWLDRRRRSMPSPCCAREWWAPRDPAPENVTAALVNPQIGLLNHRVLAKGLGGIAEHDLASLQDIAPIRHL